MKNCDYCGEEKATTTHFDPNGGLKDWNVCATCCEALEQQMKLSMGVILYSMGVSNKIGKNMMDEAITELDNISKRTGKKIISVCISKKDKNVSH